MHSFLTLLHKEVLRFFRVSLQTIAAPVLTAVLYLLVFAHAMSGHSALYLGVPYAMFLIPGLIMMSMQQNAFANTSSSLFVSKITGNIVFILLPPFSTLQLCAAYVTAAILRGVVVGAAILLASLYFALPPLAHPLWLLLFAVLSCLAFGALGMIAGLWADTFEQVALFQNFIIMPMTFLSGVFYSIESLSPFWQTVSRFNPVFYMIDGFRYGFFGRADADPLHSLAVLLGVVLLISVLTLRLVHHGYHLRR